ncbi:MAG: wax ester/triacylglycerol synthase domain-containing protein [Pseudomonadota bacterium]
MRLSAHDASFLYTETASGPMHSVLLTVLDDAVDFTTLQTFYAQRVPYIPRLRQRLAMVPFNIAHPKWVDDPDFDLNAHVEEVLMPPNSTLDMAKTKALELSKDVLPRSRPLWKILIFTNIPDQTLIAQLSHHAFVDGATLVAMSTILTDKEADAPEPAPTPEWRPAPIPSDTELWQEAAAETAARAMQDAQNTITTMRSAAQLMPRTATLVQRLARPVMLTPWNTSLVGPDRQLQSLRYELAAFRPIREATGCTLNDIVTGVVSEAAARYLEAHGEAVKDQYLRIMCPVNVRKPGADALDMSGNHVSAMFPVLPAWSMAMAERLGVVKKELDHIKANHEAEVLAQLQELQPNIPPVAMAQTLNVGTQWDPTVLAARAPLPVFQPTGQRPQTLGFNFTCTNIPGPDWVQYVAGQRVAEATGTLQLSGNLGLGFSIGSSSGSLYFNMTVDPRLVPDLDLLAQQVAACHEEAQALAAERS